MSNITKQDILDAIRRTAKENGGKPLGINRFANEIGIKPYDWKKYWARFGDAQKEAGFEPNTLTPAYSDDFLIKKIIDLIRKLGKFPTQGELRLEKRNDPEFPGRSFKEQKRKLASKIIEWCEGKSEYNDIIEFCKPVLEEFGVKEDSDDTNIHKEVGEVYLYKSGHYYKIGKTDDTVRRGKEIRIQLPERTDLIHSIKTDDPSGIEAYWHKRFEAKRMQGEWFNLNAADVKAFKRWRRIV
ncbi:MAG TPA: GIY-YIG nuclease family protein [Candidatus Brocadiia bacterium]|nr:GIY-YIG nuclease family protein [Planctomycetota bacterium]MDO8092799.1 GIY-YIG nuclease family protein [Candidatus Brocadiales bacterium]